MSKECKTARNVVSSAFIVLAVVMVIMSMSSCASNNYTTCSAYASAQK
jgi:hypothetical protein